MTMIGVSGSMFLLVPAHPSCPGQSPDSCTCKMVAVVVVVLKHKQYSTPKILTKINITRITGNESHTMTKLCCENNS